MGTGRLRSLLYLFICGIQPSITDIFSHCSGKEVCILQHHGDTSSQVISPDRCYWNAINSDTAFVNIIEAVDQIGDRRFSCPCRSYKGNILSLL